jgi:hypothetical protein
MRIRQIALVAHDLAAAEAEITSALDLEVCFRDPGVAAFGLHNALFPIGDTLLEVVSPIEEGTTAGRLLERRGGNGGYMVILQVPDVEACRERLGEVGARIVYEAKGEGILGLHVHPRDVGGAILSLDQSDPAESWAWAGNDWRRHIRTSVVTTIAGVELQAVDPAARAHRWAEVIGRRVDEPAAGDRGATITLDEGRLRFVADRDGRGEGVAGLELAAADRSRVGEQLVACGTRITLV